MGLDQELADAQRAQALLDDPLIVGFFEAMERAVYKKFKETAPSDAEQLKTLRQMLGINDKFRSHFVKYVEGGKVAAIEIEDRRKKGALARVFGASE